MYLRDFYAVVRIGGLLLWRAKRHTAIHVLFIRIRRGGTLLRDGSKLEKWTLGVRPTGDGG